MPQSLVPPTHHLEIGIKLWCAVDQPLGRIVKHGMQASHGAGVVVVLVPWESVVDVGAGGGAESCWDEILASVHDHLHVGGRPGGRLSLLQEKLNGQSRFRKLRSRR